MKNSILILSSLLLVIQLSISCKSIPEPRTTYSDFVNDDSHPAFTRELVFSIQGDSVAGYAFIANDSTEKETVILVKGFPGNDSNFDLAHALMRNGVNVILFNHRGAWGSRGTFMYSNCLEDIDGVISYILQPEMQKKLRVDPERISLVGRSYGGAVSLIQGSKNSKVKKIVAISSANYGTIMRDYNDLSELSRFSNYMKKQIMIDTDIDAFLQEMLDNKSEFDVVTYAEQLQSKKVLILEDTDKNDDWISKLTNADVVKMDGGHNFTNRRIEMIDIIIDWILKN